MSTPIKPTCGPGGEWWDENTGDLLTMNQMADELTRLREHNRVLLEACRFTYGIVCDDRFTDRHSLARMLADAIKGDASGAMEDEG